MTVDQIIDLKNAHGLDIYIESRDYLGWCAMFSSANRRDLDTLISLLLLHGVNCDDGYTDGYQWKYFVQRTE